MANGSEISKTYKLGPNGYYMETRTQITKEQERRAREAGYKVEDTGTALWAIGQFPVTPLTTLDAMVAELGTEKVRELADAQRILEIHGKNRAEMISTLSVKPNKECQAILATLEMLDKGLVEDLTPEQKADKTYLLSLLK